MFHLVHMKGKKAGFFTTDKQLAYEARKGANTNLYFQDGTPSVSAKKFCDEQLDEEYLISDIPAEDVNIGLLVDDVSDLKSGYVLELDAAPGELAAFELFNHHSNIKTKMQITAPRQSGLTNRLLECSIEMEYSSGVHIFYITHETLVEITHQRREQIKKEAGLDVFTARFTVTSLPLHEDILNRIKWLKSKPFNKLILFTDNMRVCDSVEKYFDVIYSGVNEDGDYKTSSNYEVGVKAPDRILDRPDHTVLTTSDKESIKELALASGFKLKEQEDGRMDLNPYVYDFAQQLLAQAKQNDVCEGTLCITRPIHGHQVPAANRLTVIGKEGVYIKDKPTEVFSYYDFFSVNIMVGIVE